MTRTLSEPEHVASALAAATRVPFPGGRSPCRLEAGHGRIDVLLEDGDREALAACGAAVLNMQLALRATGHAATVDLLPDRTRPELAAVVWIRATCTPSSQERALARAIPVLQEHRGPLPDGLVPLGVRMALVRAAAREEGELVLLEPPAEVGLLEHRLTEAGWLSGGAKGCGGLVAVLNSYTDTTRGQLQAGRALQRVLLTSNVQGARAVLLLRAETVQKARPELRGVLGGQATPQAVLEFGFEAPAPPRQRARRRS
ncbi:hypothetical protein LWP59_19165 [Amycolatopsis acidiphila]|uniref:Uncharacterized protein n=1 Tax=Amycolatopsis acidiphila TaxID=715473 RepID=A0A557ZPV2_9PSEU|nr:hypothetical protein [Amycolatopsis acidiphila]TVT14056.1 hypothetical protein FNH06_38260 [Amycolatopsis acidiphila]UIJ63597.1 hypothetical protein LWP59_19165 [Amycolatopsis acidiphila]GHG68025.1 hypothetical protein GCM10017788_27350 [Amycolatopsis acidiphila]